MRQYGWFTHYYITVRLLHQCLSPAFHSILYSESKMSRHVLRSSCVHAMTLSRRWCNFTGYRYGVRSLTSYKQSAIMHAIHTWYATRYLCVIAQSTASRPSHGDLPSTDTTCMQRLWTKFSERGFSHAGPAAWDSLPPVLRGSADRLISNAV